MLRHLLGEPSENSADKRLRDLTNQTMRKSSLERTQTTYSPLGKTCRRRSRDFPEFRELRKNVGRHFDRRNKEIAMSKTEFSQKTPQTQQRPSSDVPNKHFGVKVFSQALRCQAPCPCRPSCPCPRPHPCSCRDRKPSNFHSKNRRVGRRRSARQRRARTRASECGDQGLTMLLRIRLPALCLCLCLVCPQLSRVLPALAAVRAPDQSQGSRQRQREPARNRGQAEKKERQWQKWKRTWVVQMTRTFESRHRTGRRRNLRNLNCNCWYLVR